MYELMAEPWLGWGTLSCLMSVEAPGSQHTYCSMAKLDHPTLCCAVVGTHLNLYLTTGDFHHIYSLLRFRNAHRLTDTIHRNNKVTNEYSEFEL